MNPQAIKVACSNCNLRELCMPIGLSPEELDRIDDVVSTRRKIKRGTFEVSFEADALDFEVLDVAFRSSLDHARNY